MPLNLPNPITTNNISFGPGRLFLGASGATPTVDVGAIGEDGITFEVTASRRDIRQGNPGLIEYRFTQVQDTMVKLTSIEWDVTKLLYALGAGTTTSSASEDTLTWGGDPLIDTVAIHIQHQLGVAAGTTLNVYGWKGASDGGLPIAFGADEHKFEHSYSLMRSATNWAGTALATDAQLWRVSRLKT